MTIPYKYFGAIILVVIAIASLGGCTLSKPVVSSQTISDSAPYLDVELAKAAATGHPLLLLITEPGQGNPDAAVKIAEDAVRGHDIIFTHLDLGISRLRAIAARYHLTTTPLLLSLTSQGVILSRDEGVFTLERAKERVDEVERHSSEADTAFLKLQTMAKANPRDAKAQLALADFLRSHQNMREAIPLLAAVAHDDSIETSLRVHSWVDLARAHLWVTEPEKGRHEARDLIATFGATVSEARSGGSLVLGIQDAAAKRFALAREEFQAAIDAAPASGYADEARVAMAALPKEGT